MITLLRRYNENSLISNNVKKQLLNGNTIEAYENINNKLMHHQIAGAVLAEKNDRYGYFFDTGTGKTLLALEIMEKKYNDEHARFLIICPKTIIETAWLDDCDKFFPKMKIMPIMNGMKIADYERLYWRWKNKGADLVFFTKYYFEKYSGKECDRAKKILMEEAQHYITNPELFRSDYKSAQISGRPHFNMLFYSHIFSVSGLIFDESSILKNMNSKIHKLFKDSSLSKKYVYLLSGKPAPNRKKEYASQLDIIAPPLYSIWSEGTESEADRCFYVEGKRWDLLKLMDMVSMTISKEDCLDLPETVEMIRSITFDNKAMDAYIDVVNTTWQMIKESESEDVFFVAGNFMKLRQVTSGFLISNTINTEKGITEKTITDIHEFKINELLAVLEELGDNQAIIWCQFKYEIQTIEKRLLDDGKTVVTAYSETKDKNASIRDFKEGKAQYIIAHPSTLKYGVTLVNCSYAIYYSISFSFEEYYQSHDRIYRNGQENPCTYIFLLVKNTIDYIMYDAIKKKKSRIQYEEDVLKHISENLER